MQARSRVLIVDDDPDIRTLFATHLDREGFDIEEADSWRIAFEKITSFDPHVTLLDVRMPEVPGDLLVAAIKRWKPRIEVIVVSGVLSEELKAGCLSDGAFAVLNKPLEIAELISKIRESLEKQARNSENISL